MVLETYFYLLLTRILLFFIRSFNYLLSLVCSFFYSFFSSCG
jgi:hypothetical protein